jgi:hypothetical protein
MATTTTYIPLSFDSDWIGWEEQGIEPEELCEDCGDSVEYCCEAQQCEASLIWD